MSVERSTTQQSDSTSICAASAGKVHRQKPSRFMAFNVKNYQAA